MNTRIHVAVGVIYSSDRNKVLLTKRTAEQHLAGLWEFPGGKVESGEDVITALSRELGEELGIMIKETKQLTTVSYDYPDKEVLLDVWEVYEWSGEPTSKENQELVWSGISDLNNFSFPEANKHIIQTLLLSPIYVISQPSYDDYSRLISVAEECFSSGLKLFQLRLTSKEEPEYSEIIKELKALAKKNSARLILNGIPSELNEYDVDGLHLKSKELTNFKKRPIDEKYILGASCHNEHELLLAEKINVNYAFISPVSKTSSHPEKECIGWPDFYKMSKKAKFPVYALGGMQPGDLKVAKKNNAYGIAMIGAIWNSDGSVSELISS